MIDHTDAMDHAGNRQHLLMEGDALLPLSMECIERGLRDINLVLGDMTEEERGKED